MKKLTIILLFSFSLVIPAIAQHCNTGVLDPRIAVLLKNVIHDIPPAIPNIPVGQIQKDRQKADSSYGIGDLRRIIVTNDSIPISVFNTAHEKGLPVIIYYHEGGFILPLLPAMEHACWKKSSSYHAVVFAVDYRISPQYKYPAAVNDAYNALKWIMKHAQEYGGDTTKIILLGESSGANLVAVMCQKAHREGIANKIKLQILICPWLDNAYNCATHPSYQQYATGYYLTKEVMFFTQGLYTDKNNFNNPEVSPLLTKDLIGLPPALLITVEFDILRDEGELYVEKMRKAGVKVEFKCFPGQIHILKGLPPESAEIKDLNNLILNAINDKGKNKLVIDKQAAISNY
jgi:acetyl esterase